MSPRTRPPPKRSTFEGSPPIIDKKVRLERLPPTVRSFLANADYCYEVVATADDDTKRKYWCAGCQYYWSLPEKKRLKKARADIKTKKYLCPQIWKKDTNNKQQQMFKENVLLYIQENVSVVDIPTEALAEIFPDAMASDGAIGEAPGTNHGICRTEGRKGLVGDSDEFIASTTEKEDGDDTTTTTDDDEVVVIDVQRQPVSYPQFAANTVTISKF